MYSQAYIVLIGNHIQQTSPPDVWKEQATMTPLYKEGLYWLILLVVTTLVYMVLAFLIGPMPASAAFGLLGLGGFLVLLYRKQGKEVLLDERDTQIAQRALIAGYSIFWLVSGPIFIPADTR
jgi:hypothetical protein